jgi:hypothetical protein
MKLPLHVVEEVLHVLEVHQHFLFRAIDGAMEILRFLREMESLNQQKAVRFGHLFHGGER